VSEEHATGLALAFQLLDMGLRMQAQRYRREHPEASDDEVDAFVQAWLSERPGAPQGDGPPGRLVSLPRRHT
jgi:hypothetical protein